MESTTHNALDQFRWIDGNTVKEILSRWTELRGLGNHHLAQLGFVEARIKTTSYPFNYSDRGLALREAIKEAINRLRPNLDEPKLTDPRWRSYLIIVARCAELGIDIGPTIDVGINLVDDHAFEQQLQEKLGIARAAFYKAQARAYNHVAEQLRIMAEIYQASASPVDYRGFFRAPARSRYRLVGRSDLVGRLKDQLKAGYRIVLQGLPGAGKTALALSLVYDQNVLTDFPEGVLWVGLGPQPNIMALLGMCAEAVGVTDEELRNLMDVDQRSQVIRQRIGVRKLLIILDDIWNETDARPFFFNDLHCVYIITTRSPKIAASLTSAPEYNVPVPELSLPDSIELLGSIAPVLRTVQPSEIQDLVHVTGMLPLALVLIGKYLSITPAERTAPLQSKIRAVIRKLRRAANTRQRQLKIPQEPAGSTTTLAPGIPVSLFAVIEVSFLALPTFAQQALRGLAILPPKPNTFSEEAGCAIINENPEMINMLYLYGLLEHSRLDRYTLHQSIKEFITLKGIDTNAYERMVNYFVEFVDNHQTDYDSLNLDFNNILIALNTARGRDMLKAFVRGTNSFALMLETRGSYEEAQALLSGARETAIAMHDVTGEATTLLHLGRVQLNRGNYDQAETVYQQGIRLAQELNLRELLSGLLADVGVIAFSRGDYSTAQTYYDESLVLAQETGDGHRITGLYISLGALALKQGHLDQAVQYFQDGLDLARFIKDREREVTFLINLGAVAGNRGDNTVANKYYHDSLLIAREIGHADRISAILTNLGAVAYRAGDYKQATQFFEEGRELAHKIGHAERETALLSNLGAIAEAQDDDERAKLYYQESLKIARVMGYRERISVLTANLGTVARKHGKYSQAMELLDEGLKLAQELEHPILISAILTEWGWLYLAQTKTNAAIDAFQKASDVAHNVEYKEFYAVARFGLAQCAAAEGRPDDARHDGEESAAIFESIGHYKAAEVRQWLAALL